MNEEELQAFDVVVEHISSVAEGVVAVELGRVDGMSLPRWRPGAHIDLLMPGGIERQYSLCGAPDGPNWQVAVLREAVGRGGSRWVCDEARQGDVVRVRGPRNHFPLIEAPSYLLFAGGIGITPILAMARELSADGSDFKLVYGGRTLKSMAFVDEVKSLGDHGIVCAQDETGLIDLRLFLEEASEHAAVYCCGPEALLAAVEATCEELGRSAPKVERFSAPEPTTRSTTECECEFEIEIAGTGAVYRVPADKSILEVLEANGYDGDHSCREGICGSCEITVLAGDIDHRDFVLSQGDKDSNDAMMVCVSRSRGSRIVLAP